MVDTSLDIGCISGYKVCNGFSLSLYFFFFLSFSFFLSFPQNQLQQKVVAEAMCHILLKNATSFLFRHTN